MLIEKEEAPKALEQLSIALNVCTAFKETYATYKDTASAGTFIRRFLLPALPPYVHNLVCFVILTLFPTSLPTSSQSALTILGGSRTAHYLLV